MTKNIVLIGMCGCGKSTLGVVLAKKLGYRFLDCDLVIQDYFGRTLEELIDEHGDSGFIQIENDIDKNVKVDRTVIATGGSAVYGAEAMANLKENGIMVYLEMSMDLIRDRVGDLTSRGVVTNGKETIDEVFEDRKALYEKYADVTLHVQEEKLRETVERLYELVKSLDY